MSPVQNAHANKCLFSRKLESASQVIIDSAGNTFFVKYDATCWFATERVARMGGFVGYFLQGENEKRSGGQRWPGKPTGSMLKGALSLFTAYATYVRMCEKIKRSFAFCP